MLRGSLAVCIPLSFCLTVSGATLKLDPTVEFQTIDGFGGFGGKSVNWSPPIWDDNFGNLMINDWGLTISRQEYYPGDGKYDCDNDMIMDFNRRLKAGADAAGEPLKFLCTFWSPPGYWKNNGSATGGGNLNADRYDRHRASRAQRDHAVRPELHPPPTVRAARNPHTGVTRISGMQPGIETAVYGIDGRRMGPASPGGSTRISACRDAHTGSSCVYLVTGTGH